MLKQGSCLLILLAILCAAPLVCAQAAASQPPPLITEGDPDRGIAPCSGCHQPNGGGSEAGAAARLAGIGEQYIVNQIENFRNGNRNPAAHGRLMSRRDEEPGSPWVMLPDPDPEEAVAVGRN